MTVIDTSRFDPMLLERAARVRILVLDVDGVMTDGQLYFDNLGNEMKTFSTRDGLGIRALQFTGTPVALITARQSNIVERRAANLGIEQVYQGSNDKLAAFDDILKRTGLGEDEACYVGDDWLDIPVLERAGLVSIGQDAQRRPRRLNGAALKEAEAWIERHLEIWEMNYARLDTLLAELQSAPQKKPPTKK